MIRSRLVLVCLFLVPAVAAARADAVKDDWTTKRIESETTECTEATVKDAWENTKREQGADPSLPLTPEIRKELAPQIAAMKKLCACAIREAAKRYTWAEAQATPGDLQNFIAETVSKGTCKLER